MLIEPRMEMTLVFSATVNMSIEKKKNVEVLAIAFYIPV